jgi:hypothetical protein
VEEKRDGKNRSLPFHNTYRALKHLESDEEGEGGQDDAAVDDGHRGVAHDVPGLQTGEPEESHTWQEWKLSAASCGETSILTRNNPFRFLLSTDSKGGFPPPSEVSM